MIESQVMAKQDFEQLISSPTATYDEALSFFAGTGTLNNTLRRIAQDLEKHGIDYNVIGGVALADARQRE